LLKEALDTCKDQRNKAEIATSLGDKYFERANQQINGAKPVTETQTTQTLEKAA